MVEGIHFELRYTPPYFLGRKAVAASLSDIAAMGGSPRAVFCTVAVPAKRKPFFARAVLEGIHEEAQASGTAVLGGDMCGSSGPITIDVAALGEAVRSGPVLRSGARRGDGIYVSGSLGGSAAGLALLRKGFEPWSKHLWNRDLKASNREAERSRIDLLAALSHLLPRPRLGLGQILAQGRIASAMIDLSDGLSTDLHNLCEASGVGARIEARHIPLHPALSGGSNRALRTALSGGEDYELLFTVPPKAEKRLARAASAIDLPITRIGKITSPREEVTILGRDGKRRRLARTGYEHFRD
jgi:thiamine-monophosphate kinase